MTCWQSLGFFRCGRADMFRAWKPRRQSLLKPPGELSRGMKQKLAIACGLLHSPEVDLSGEVLQQG